MQIHAYLFFEGRCDEAVDFYRTALGAEVLMLMRYKDGPEPHSYSPDSAEKVMHASLRIGNSIVQVSDGRCSGKPSFQGFALSLTAPSDAEVERLFAALSDGGQVQVALTKTFFATRFGMVIDRFGVLWIVHTAQ